MSVPEGSDVRRPVFARLYPRVARALDDSGLAEHRRRLLAGLSGEVVEVGAGPGGNFRHYPSGVTHVLAVEPEPRLRELAGSAATRAPVPVTVVSGVADRLPAPDHAADAVVFCLVLCSVPDVAAALAEARRVLRPGGRLHALEHVRADSPGLARVQRVLDATLWPALAGGCHVGRDTGAAIAAAGFAARQQETFLFPPRRTPSSPHILTVAAAT